MQKINNILKENNIKILKRYGQNFLIDNNIIQKITDEIDDKIKHVLEIGPGLGALTDNILKKNKNIVAIEIDNKMSVLLNKKYNSKIKIINEDILNINLHQIEEKYFKNDKYTIISNLPYYITSPIIFKLLETTRTCSNLILMMQKEVADRIIAKKDDKKYNSFSLICQYYCDIKKIISVPASCFFPKPKVHSSVLSFKMKKSLNLNKNEEKEFIAFIKKLFTYNRKTILNNLSTITSNKLRAQQILNKLDLNINLRPCNLSLKNCYNLFIELKRYKNED